MANCIQPSEDMMKGIVLDPSMFDYSTMKECSDIDKTKIVREKDEFVFYMGFTTRRELRNFVWNYIQPHVKIKNVKIPVEYTDEYDNFRDICRSTIHLYDPGTIRNGDPKQWENILK